MTEEVAGNAGYPIRLATIDEVETLVELRLAMFQAMGVAHSELEPAIAPYGPISRGIFLQAPSGFGSPSTTTCPWLPLVW